MARGTILVVVWKGKQFSHCYGKKNNNSRCFEKENNMTCLFIFYGKKNNCSMSGLRKENYQSVVSVLWKGKLLLN
jgi:hypothetical protein